MNQNIISRHNNFDLIRLIAASQVAILHAAYHLDIDIDNFKNILKYIPGVPVFFTISGFLIASSYQQSNSLTQYFINRALRIFPALWVCFGFTFILLRCFQKIPFEQMFSLQFWAWIGTQISFFQFYTPEFLRSWGTGNPNGSLWTIPVEIQFYLFLPLCSLLFTRINIYLKYGVFFILSVIFNFFLGGREDTITLKLMGVSLFPFLYNFLLGTIIFKLWRYLRKWFEGKALWWLLIFVVYCNLGQTMPEYYPTIAGFFANIILAFLVISTAFTYTGLSDKILKKIDISYGIYIYHMPIINSLIALKLTGNYIFMIIALTTTLLFALLSWFLVEKRAISKKKLISEKWKMI